jgi:hypothetical protein
VGANLPEKAVIFGKKVAKLFFQGLGETMVSFHGHLGQNQSYTQDLAYQEMVDNDKSFKKTRNRRKVPQHYKSYI